MALTQRLQLRQSHALVMTPQLMQAIKLLQLSNLDLAGYVETELERNPLLERGSDAGPEPEPEAAERDAGPAAGDPGSEWDGAGFEPEGAGTTDPRDPRADSDGG